MKRFYLIILVFGSAILTCTAQDFKTIRPQTGETISYSVEEQNEWSRAMELLKKIDNGELNYKKDLTESERDLIDRLEMCEGPMTQGPGCSWYCGGGPYKILSSSSLDDVKYKAENVHDFNLLTAWVEGKSDYGIGEYIEFYFKPNSPRINKLIFYNGYFKNQDLWESNSRIKEAKLYINGKFYALLEFQDISAPQIFPIDPVRSTVANQDLVLRIEIAGVYKGTKYSDVAVSEINFDGLDVHCLARGSKILLTDNSTKNIEDLKTGDSIACIDFNTHSIKPAVIEKTEKAIHNGLATYRFESGLEITATPDHPFRVQDKGWASLQPEKSRQYKGFENIGKITIGDLFVTIGGTDKLIAVDYPEGEMETYTISELSAGDNFIVGGLIAGIEEVKE